MIKVTRIYTGAEGESHFQDTEIPLEVEAHLAKDSKPLKADGPYFRESLGVHDSISFHPAPHRQYVIILSGELGIEIGNGEKRVFGKGDIFLAEDITGHGHIARINNPQMIVIPLAET